MVTIHLRYGIRRLGAWLDRPVRPFPNAQRTASVTVSLVLHGALAAGLVVVPPLTQDPEARRYSVDFIPLARDTKPLIWYKLGERLPAIDSGEKLPDQDRPLHLRDASQNISAAPEAKPGKAFIWSPTPRIAPVPSVPMPNLIAFEAPNAPAPQPKPSPRQFQAPVQQTPAATPTLLSSPDLHVNGQPVQAAKLHLPVKYPPAPFVLTPATTPATQSKESLADIASPDLAAAIGDGAPVSAAVIGLDASELLKAPIPEGSRRERISAGPPGGSTNGDSQPAQAARITVPGLSVSEGVAGAVRRNIEESLRRDSAPPLTAPRTGFHATPSASQPLWPGTRVLDPLVESRFEGRVAFATVTSPPPGIGAFDWTIWFACKEPLTRGKSIFMRPPFPLKPAPSYRPVGGVVLEVRVYLTAIVGKDGRIRSVALVNGSSLDPGFMQALDAWELSPATRNGDPVEVDVVIEASVPAPQSRAQKIP